MALPFLSDVAVRQATTKAQSILRRSVLYDTRLVGEHVQRQDGRYLHSGNYGVGATSRRTITTVVASQQMLRMNNMKHSVLFGHSRHINRSVSRRLGSSISRPGKAYEAVVVGAGPAGVSAVGNLIDNKIEPVLWIDPDFSGGRVNKYYREVPSNTKVKLFIDFGLATQPFRKIVQENPPHGQTNGGTTSSHGDADMLRAMRSFDQEKGCSLAHAADMCLGLTHGLRNHPGVTAVEGTVTDATLDEQDTRWQVQTQTNHPSSSSQAEVSAKRLVLCTGSTPLDPPLPVDLSIKHLNLDDVLSPTRLSHTLSTSSNKYPTVAVIGASHSAILVLMNLSHLAQTTLPGLRIKWFTRHPLRYAEYFPTFIARDNTGLKGEAAVWARQHLEPAALSDTAAPDNPVRAFLEKIAYEKGAEPEVYAAHLPGCDFVVQAIGYQRNALPRLTRARDGKVIEPVFDHNTGVFTYEKQEDEAGTGEKVTVPGLFGAGIAFPERVVDKKYGHEELNVGFGKFMKAIKNWMPVWKGVEAA